MIVDWRNCKIVLRNPQDVDLLNAPIKEAYEQQPIRGLNSQSYPFAITGRH